MKNFKKTFTTLTITCMMGAMLTGCSGKNDIDKDFANQAISAAPKIRGSESKLSK